MDFRDYENAPQHVKDFYLKHHREQTYEKVEELEKRYLKLEGGEMTIWEMFEVAQSIVDESDPDTEENQMLHAIQTAERVRRLYPEEKWLHLAALIHDLGKILAAVPAAENCNPLLAQHFVVGDINPVGCPYSDKIVFHSYFAENPDSSRLEYQTESDKRFGVYQKNCGFMNVKFTFGHDEYLYNILLCHNLRNLPHNQIDGRILYVVRHHSFYAWHRDGAYTELASEHDWKMLPWLQAHSNCDLYSKKDDDVCPGSDGKDSVRYYKDLVETAFGKDTKLKI